MLTDNPQQNDQEKAQTPRPEQPQAVAITQALPQPFPNVGQGFGLLGYFILFQVAIVLLLMLATTVFTDDDALQEWSTAIVYISSIVTVILMANNKRRSDNFSFRKIPVSIYLILLLLVPALAVVTEPIIRLIPINDWAKQLLSTLTSSHPLIIMLIVIAAPILEELLFRGIILDGFLKRYSPWKAILWSSFLFGLIHLNPWQFIGAFILGIVMGWLYWKTQSLLPCIFMHFVNNGLASIGMVISDDPWASSRQTINNDLVYFALLAAGVVLVIVCIVVLMRILKSITPDTNTAATS